MQEFKQIVYYQDSSNANNPARFRKSAMVAGEFFTGNSGVQLVQLGVQAPPGTKFYINGNTDPVIIGFTGLFELDFSQGGYINSVKFDELSIDKVDNNDSAMIIVDMVTR